ncbi:MAG: TIGR00730 family Rossman fold protein [Nakamurella sp.]
MSEAEITVSAVVVRDPQGQVLTVRKRGTARFMLPGGKPEPGESALDAAVREFGEELGVRIESSRLTLWGTYLTAAANETSTRLVATVYEHPTVELSGPAAEIAELRWLDPTAPDSGHLAPLLTDVVFPRLRSSGISRVTIFAGAYVGADPDHLERARRLGAGLAERGIGLVFGGGRVGLMGAVADAALDAGGEVIGVMPQHLVDREIAHQGLSRLEVVGSMHERKQRMAELGDAFIALPGGAGTLEELFEVWTWQNLGLHAKPIALYGRQF